MSASNDPSALFRDMLGQWERMASSFGGDAGKPPEAAFREAAERTMALANVATRADVEVLTTRLDAIEAALARIERALASPARRRRAPPPPEGTA